MKSITRFLHIGAVYFPALVGVFLGYLAYRIPEQRMAFKILAGAVLTPAIFNFILLQWIEPKKALNTTESLPCFQPAKTSDEFV